MGFIDRFTGNTIGNPAGIVNVSRRRFLEGTGGLALGLYLNPLAAGTAAAATPKIFEPNAFVQIGTDSSVTVIAKHLEMGQGVFTGLATLVAEELDADWNSVRVIGAPADNARYKHLFFGIQATGGSTAMANSWEQMRRAGATGRAMLVAAAAGQWKVAPETVTVSNGVVMHAKSGRKARFGQLVSAASKQPVPENVTLKDPKDFKLIGKLNVPRRDSLAKTDGTAVFTQDIQLPGMLVAVSAHPPRFGTTVKSFDATKAEAVPGVKAVIAFAGTPYSFPGVAVLATNTWAARQGRDALAVQWDDTHAFKLGSAEILAQYREAAGRDGAIARRDGDAAASLASADKVIEADYEVPYLAHASMEPLNCVVRLGDGRCEIWNGEQWHTVDQMNVAKHLGIAPDDVAIHQLYAGGSFGRRANPHSDFLLEAVSIAKAARDAGITAPVKMVWTREDDTRGGYYRPIFFHRARLGIDGEGKLAAWHHRTVGQSFIFDTAFESFIKDGVDPLSVEGISTLPYHVPNLQVELHIPKDIGVPTQWYRSVGHTHTAFVTETLIDEAAAATDNDAVRYRGNLLAQHPRHRGVLALAAEKAGWNQPLAPGKNGEKRGRGIAVHESFNTFVAQVAEVTVRADGSFKVDRIVCAVDCGIVVNPDVVKAQMEGGIGFGLSTALHGAITLKDGVVEQSNFHDYPVLRIQEMPKVEVHIVPSAEAPTGVGEPGVPPVAPAVANALFVATGRRLRRLPLGTQIGEA